MKNRSLLAYLVLAALAAAVLVGGYFVMTRDEAAPATKPADTCAFGTRAPSAEGFARCMKEVALAAAAKKDKATVAAVTVRCQKYPKTLEGVTGYACEFTAPGSKPEYNGFAYDTNPTFERRVMDMGPIPSS